MLLSVNQIQDLLHIIENNTNAFIAKHIGSDYLTTEEKRKLADIGINSYNLYDKDSDLITQSFHFGLISDALGVDASKITFEELKEYFNKGKHIPLTKVEQHALDSIKKQFLGDIKSNKGKIFNDLTGVISSNEKDNREAYEKVIREEIKQGIVDRKTVAQIASDLGHKTGDWSRNFTRIIEYQSHQALSEGRIAAIERSGGKKVYMSVYLGACINCVKLYLTDGLGSAPIIFNIDDLKKNGTNIGRKVNEWKAVIPPMHPFCRCHPVVFREGSIWNKESKKFELSKKLVIEGRKPIKFTVRIGNKEKEYFI